MTDVEKQMQHDAGLITVLQKDVTRLRAERGEWRRKYFEMERAQSRSIDLNGEHIKRIQRLERDKDELRSEIVIHRPATPPETARSWRKFEGRPDLIAVRDLPDGRQEFLCHNEALCEQYYTAVSRPHKGEE